MKAKVLSRRDHGIISEEHVLALIEILHQMLLEIHSKVMSKVTIKQICQFLCMLNYKFRAHKRSQSANMNARHINLKSNCEYLFLINKSFRFSRSPSIVPSH